MTHARVEDVVRAQFGLDPEALGATAFSRAIEKRMNGVGVVTTADYLTILTSNPAEQNALAAELVVPETWFYRGGHALFNSLATFIATRAESRPPDALVRVLSVPCSTGEEPFSLAIALDEHHVRPFAYSIEGVDLSVPHLTRARAGRFTTFAFRETGPDIRSTHFQQVGDLWELRPSVRERVRFTSGNATDPNFLAGEHPFDLILCRNLFIYLIEEARGRALANLDRLLAADGWVVLSPAEAGRLSSKRFVATGSLSLGIYQRAAVRDTVTLVDNSGRSPALKQVSRPTTATHTHFQRDGVPPSPPPPELSAAPTLEGARKLADAGHLSAARSVCERLLAQTANDADIYSLLGMVNLAEGRPADAADLFRKALYLDPNHPDALSHMIVICDSRGDTVQATAFRKRLARTVREDPA